MGTSLSATLTKIDEIREKSIIVNNNHRSYLQQLGDLVSLYRVNPTCKVWDYYLYRLYCSERGSTTYRDTLGISVSEALSRSLNKRAGVTAAWNKLVFAVLCHAYGIPTGKLLGVFRPHGPIADFVPSKMHTLESVRSFLASLDTPVFMKPVHCKQGKGAYCVATFDAANDTVELAGGERIGFDDFIIQTIDYTGNASYQRDQGYLFQQLIPQHPIMTEFTGNPVPSGFRIVVLNEDTGPVIHRAIWKIMAPGNISDNFHGGTRGNMVVKVDPGTGRLSDAVDGYWPHARRHAAHPLTGSLFRDFSIPEWNTMVSMLKHASAAFSTMKILHWDVIMSPEGPVTVELNDIGGTRFLQLHEQPLMDERLRSFVRRHGNLESNKKLKRKISTGQQA